MTSWTWLIQTTLELKSRQTYRFIIRIGPVNLPAKFEVRSFTRSCDKRGSYKLQTLNLEEGDAIGVPFERALVSSYRPSTVTLPPSLRVSEFAAFVLQNAIFPITHLVSPKFSRDHLGISGSPFCYKKRRCWVIDCAISFQEDFQPITIHQRHRQTDGQTDRRTDGRHAIARPR